MLQRSSAAAACLARAMPAARIVAARHAVASAVPAPLHARPFSKAAAAPSSATTSTSVSGSSPAAALPNLLLGNVSYVAAAAVKAAGSKTTPALQAVALFLTEEELQHALAAARAHQDGASAPLELEALLSAAGGESGSSALFEGAVTLAPSSDIWTDFTAKAGETVWLYPTASSSAKKSATFPRVLLVGLGAAAKVQLGSFRSATWKAISSFQSASLVERVGVVLPQPPVMARFFDSHLAAEIGGTVARIAALSNHTALRNYLAPETLAKRKKKPIANIELIDMSSAPSTPATAITAAGEKKTRKPRASAFHPLHARSSEDRASAVRAQVIVAEATALAREWANERGDVCTPAYMEAQARALAAKHKDSLTVRVLQDADLEKEGLELIRAVGRGASAPNKPRLVVLEYKGSDVASGKGPVSVSALVGKGVTFDTGGLHLKARGNIEGMHIDMAGSACVLAVMQALPQLAYPGHVVGVLALAENAISNESFKPLAILPSVKGSVEVGDTDAEGRLVLADAFTFVQRHYKPASLIDLATLTGASVVALGENRAAIFANPDPLPEDAEQQDSALPTAAALAAGNGNGNGFGGPDASSLANALIAAGERVGERLWRLPIDDAHRDELKGSYSDMRNLGPAGSGRYGGASIAAAFLEKFVEPRTAWSHIDLAGPAMRSRAAEWQCEGGTGFGTQLLLDYFAQRQRTESEQSKVEQLRRTLANFKESDLGPQQE